MTVVVALLERTTRATFAQPVLDRENYRGHHLPTAAGLLLVVGVVAVEGIRELGAVAGVADGPVASARVAILVAVVTFGFLGLVDDLLGDNAEKGLAGHIRALRHRRATTGLLKLGGGAAIALLLAGANAGDRPGRALVDGALIALAANMGNLFDRAPGRTIKVGLVAYVPLAVIAATSATGVALGVVAGAALGLLPGDLRERSMLGDTGANALGAALGVATVLEAGEAVRTVVMVLLLAATLISEKVSFSRVIARTPPLQLIDRLGRRPEAPSP
jgi:UDP-N-acetylmuramyl pentapeptide phosphotransferase/UDP-N-acetylglucosamine-1-phosphate transferase